MMTEIRRDQFKRNVGVLAAWPAAVARQKFIQTSLDTETDFFRHNIKSKRRFSDGNCYEGYLWDCLARYSKVSFKTILRRLLRYKKVLAFWDIHSHDRILIEDYWLFPKHAVLEIRSEILAANLVFLPQDLYIFDDSFSWALILTHEYDEKGDIFLAARPVKSK
jgi:hypothetical protein